MKKKITAWAIATVVVLVVVSIITTFVVGGVSWITAPFRGEVQAREQIQSGTNKITQYDKFFDDCASIRSKQQNLVTLQEQADQLTGRAKENTLTTITAVRFQLTNDINNYEADAAKSYTNGQFRDSHLPFIIPIKGVVSCVSYTQ